MRPSTRSQLSACTRVTALALAAVTACAAAAGSSHSHRTLLLCCVTLQDASVLLDAWQRLLLDPATTLAAGGSLRGQLLSRVSCLIDDVVAGKATAAGRDGTAVLVAALRLLQLNPNINRWVVAGRNGWGHTAWFSCVVARPLKQCPGQPEHTVHANLLPAGCCQGCWHRCPAP